MTISHDDGSRDDGQDVTDMYAIYFAAAPRAPTLLVRQAARRASI